MLPTNVLLVSPPMKAEVLMNVFAQSLQDDTQIKGQRSRMFFFMLLQDMGIIETSSEVGTS